ncbi:methionine ABC transporter substrate-binding lipoprotein MetQ [Aeromonas sp. MR19]|jgi:D-methionine transport system substrate-binding protein|uniref:Lipoprotein n=1 Tax=Aeromonas bestiarum TaxID=105751 RepID=A0ABT7Q4K1_9GAMM|nr:MULTISPECIES: methionine ABC transporter substrate-binding lipoprotein MetQ [Aeromonas]ATL97115.1 MetQ/NlpA family lipoprotein [Aeromonas sp. CA23]EKP0276878.1 methionine ABC transporter substrate-binding lipoprotein MetQ [Aeromonas bestiarum]KFN17691.1 DL-methionine transporter substrate-binding subunit [Aeromonas bestiarum]MCH7376707.1 methionine ABC transporter substrate-binding lipoprotein MetQ [Aeromonas sp. MR19]MDM5074004.1 methionine ABC transporter substrate-binding lipoprotein Met
MKFGIKSVAAALLAGLVLAGCGQKEENKTLKVGAIAGAESQLVEAAAKVAKDKYGLTVEVVTFSDFATPNVALNDGSIDLNAFQHKPYLDSQVKDRGFDLVPVGNTFVYPIAGYSKKIKALADLKEGAQIAVPNDPTNLGRSLILLQKQGLLTLKEGTGLEATVLDIASNPKKLKIVELEAAQLPRSLEDVDLAIINTVYASQIDLLPSRDGLFVEDKDSPYVNLIVSRGNNKDDAKVKEFVQAFQSDEVYKTADELFKGGIVKGW